MNNVEKLEVFDDARDGGWSAPGWLSSLRLSRPPKSSDDVIEFIDYISANLDRVSPGRAGPEDLSADGVAYIADAWRLALTMAAEQGWPTVPPEPKPDQHLTFYTARSRKAFLYLDALTHLMELKRYVRSLRRSSSRNAARVANNRIEEAQKREDLIRTYLHRHSDATVREVSAGLAEGDEDVYIPRTTIGNSRAWKEHMTKRRGARRNRVFPNGQSL